jgi:hypothetical protein
MLYVPYHMLLKCWFNTYVIRFIIFKIIFYFLRFYFSFGIISRQGN